jgi:hypothetical protein
MANPSKRGRPAGEVQVGVGFDEKLKRLAELFQQKGWSFSSESAGTINAESLQRLATEQEADAVLVREAWARYQQTHEPVMQRQGARGAIFSAALMFARTAARRNRELLRLLDDLRIRPATRRAEAPEPAAPTA